MYGPAYWDELLEMYLTFEPKGVYQGLPPFKEDMIRKWLSSLVEERRNSNLVLCLNGRVIGHAALVYSPTRRVNRRS